MSFKSLSDILAPRSKATYLLYGSIFVLYLLLRLLSWQQNLLLEDHDSLSYLKEAHMFLRGDWQALLETSPDSTPLYPALISIFGLLWGGNVDAGARLASFSACILIFWLIILLGKKLDAPPIAIAGGLFAYTINPYFISASYAVLTEPTYVALSFLGLVLFIQSLKNLSVKSAIGVGALFGISFFCRTEGILYLASIPAIVVAFYVVERLHGEAVYSMKKIFAWCAIYALVFLIVVSPQIISVSLKMGHVAINGRQVWTLILKSPDGQGYEEKIYGLDHSDHMINLRYLQSHPKALSSIVSSGSMVKLLKIIINNFHELMFVQLPALFGPIGIGLFFVGALAVYNKEWIHYLLAIVLFLGAVMTGPLIHNVVMRHIAIIGPPIFLLQGIGIHLFINRFTIRHSISKLCLLLFFCGLLAVQFLMPLKRLYAEVPTYTWEYEPKVINSIAEKYIPDDPNLNIAARKAYLPYYANANRVYLPYAEYGRLVLFCKLNNVDYVFLQHRMIKDHPFLAEFVDNRDSLDEFELIHAEKDAYGKPVELYRFVGDSSSHGELPEQEDKV